MYICCLHAVFRALCIFCVLKLYAYLRKHFTPNFSIKNKLIGRLCSTKKCAIYPQLINIEATDFLYLNDRSFKIFHLWFYDFWLLYFQWLRPAEKIFTFRYLSIETVSLNWICIPTIVGSQINRENALIYRKLTTRITFLLYFVSISKYCKNCLDWNKYKRIWLSQYSKNWKTFCFDWNWILSLCLFLSLYHTHWSLMSVGYRHLPQPVHM